MSQQNSSFQLSQQSEKNINKKVTRMEHEFQDLIMKTEFLKSSKQKIKKDIEFYKNTIDRLAFMYESNNGSLLQH